MAAASPALLNVVATGSGGVDQLQTAMGKDPNAVYFAVVQITAGSGSYAKRKLIFIHVNNATAPVLKRAKAGARKGDCLKAIGEVHAQVTVEKVEDVTLDLVLSEVGRSISADSSASSVNLQALKADYEAMIASRAASAGGAGGAVKGVNALAGVGRKTAVELGAKVVEKALEAVQSDNGMFNWALYNPDWSLINAGSLSVMECKRFLKPDDCAFGIMRLGFGSGRFKRVKHIALVYSGPSASVIKRAKFGTAKAGMRSKLGHYHLELAIMSPEELTLPAVIDKVKRAAVVDGDEVSTADGVFSMESFMAALKEEAKANAAVFGDSGDIDFSEGGGGDGGPPARPASEIVNDVHKGALTWVLFTPNV